MKKEIPHIYLLLTTAVLLFGSAGGRHTNFFTRSRPGSIVPIPRSRHSQGWHLITGYIDRNFYNEILNAETWDAIHSELSYYEKIFFGMFRKVSTPRFGE